MRGVGVLGGAALEKCFHGGVGGVGGEGEGVGGGVGGVGDGEVDNDGGKATDVGVLAFGVAGEGRHAEVVVCGGVACLLD